MRVAGGMGGQNDAGRTKNGKRRTLTLMNKTPLFDVRRIPADKPEQMEAIRALRGRVLYPGLTPERRTYAGDDDPATIHIGAFTPEQNLVGLCSLFPRPDGSLQLRGMAVDSGLQGTGVGALVLREAERIAANENKPLWCNARLAAVGFYERLGWRTEGDAFEVPDIGTHYIMRAETGVKIS